MQIKNVIFDLGAVMFDWNPKKIAVGFTSDTALQQRIENELFYHPDWVAFDCAHITEQEAMQRASERLGMPIDDARRLFQQVKDSLVLIEDTHAMLKKVKAMGLSAYCLSNISPELFSHLAEQHDLFDLFDGIVTSGEENTGKPGREIFEILIQRYQLDPEQCLFIDDSADNTATAKSMGMQVVTFRGSENCYQQIAQYLP